MIADELYNIIQRIEIHKRSKRDPLPILRQKHIIPECTRYGVNNEGVDLRLRELLDDSRIQAGRTINDIWIKTV